MTTDNETLARRDAIRHVLRTARVGTQEELRARLAKVGFVVTQATLSRDLSRLRARRVNVPEQGSVYELDTFKAESAPDDLTRMRDMVVAVEESAAIVVVMTAPGAASSVALALDRARLPEALGTIAGDDTIFVAPARTSSAAAVTKLLRKIWKKGWTVMSEIKKKIVLAYSGGLDTSVLVRILREDYGYDVVACHVDVGEARDPELVRARAQKAGAVASEIVSAQEEFAKEYCFPALQANALYEGVYPLSAALSRPLIAKHLVLAAKKHGAEAVAHGATGKGNDQVRFDLAVKGLAPHLKIVAPQREKNITRDAAMEYAKKHGIEVPTTVKSPFSVDENLWGRSIEGGVLEDPATEPPEEAFAWTRSWKDAPNEPAYLTIGFKSGLPVSVDGAALSPAALLKRVGQVAGEHGVGRIDLMENRVVGIKSRELYECPAAITLITAHRDLERFTTLGPSRRVKTMLDQKYAELIYEGFWFSPYRDSLQAFNDVHDRSTTGEVRMRFFKGACMSVGRTSPFGIYNKSMSTYGVGDLFDHKAAEGFIQLLGLELQEYGRVHGTGK